MSASDATELLTTVGPVWFLVLFVIAGMGLAIRALWKHNIHQADEDSKHREAQLRALNDTNRALEMLSKRMIP